MDSIHADVAYINELIREYLLYRGYSRTLGVLENEVSKDPTSLGNPNAVVDEIVEAIKGFKLEQVFQRLNGIRTYLLTKLTDHYALAECLGQLDRAVKQYYIVYCVSNNRIEKATEMFTSHGDELRNDPEWRVWFTLPYITAPTQDAFFAPYFDAAYADQLISSLRNSLQLLFDTIPLPSMMLYKKEVVMRRNLEDEITHLKEENTSMRAQITALQAENRALMKVKSSSSSNTLSSMLEPQPTLTTKATGGHMTLNKTRRQGIGSEVVISEDGIQSFEPADWPPSETYQVPDDDDLTRYSNILDLQLGAKHNADVNAVKFSCDGMLCASSSCDGTVKYVCHASSSCTGYGH